MHLVLALLLAAAIQVQDVAWKDGPPTLPAGTKAALHEGDPKQPGLFTMRLKVPAGSAIAPHTHPRAERVTVLSGRVTVTLGTTKTTFTTGGFYVTPPDAVHSVAFEEDSVLQLTCEGPWVLEYVK